MATQVNVTLTALNGNFTPSERVLNLHPEHPSIQIGRASKSISKGLLGAADNAWFDSPVMSRDHAEMIFNSEDNTITIQDIGSMHGTYLNNLELERKTPKEVKDGDKVVFGAEVRRGPDTFPACAFRINYVFSPFTSKNSTFAFPDSSDVEDEEYEISDDDINEGPLSEDGLSMESRPVKASQTIHAIDLTRDDSPAAFSIDAHLVLDETASAQRLSESHLAGSDLNTHPMCLKTHAGNPIILDSDDEDIHLSSNSDNESEDADSIDSSSLDGFSLEENEHEESEIDDSSEDQDLDHESCSNAASPEPESHQAAIFTTSEMFTFGHHDNASFPLTNLRTHIEASEKIRSDDDTSELGLSDAGREGIQALFDNGLLENDHQDYLQEVKLGGMNNTSLLGGGSPKRNLADEKCDLPKHVTLASIPSLEKSTGMMSRTVDPVLASACSTDFLTSQNGPNQSANVRQPSPSDAAMVKSDILLPRGPAAKLVTVHHLPTQDWRQLTAQSLGDKTGKHAFFEAREGNKSNFNNAEAGIVSTCFTVRSQLAREVKDEQNFNHESRFNTIRQAAEREEIKLSVPTSFTPSAASEESRLTQERLKGLKAADVGEFLNQSIDEMLLSGSAIPSLSYLDNHAQVPLVERDPSPLPDMTSAVKYNESKALMATANREGVCQSGRSRLSIDDIIDRSSVDQPKSNKRKADDISDVIEKEIRVWASNPSALGALIGSTNVSESGSRISTSAKGVEMAQNVASGVPDSRPVKKLKKFVESVGYAALGGAFVGASLFSVLVATAPDFL